MPDAFMPIHDDGLAADHGEHVAFGTDAGAGGAANAVITVDVRVLRFGSFGKQLALLGGLAGTSLPLLQASQVDHQEEKTDNPADAIRDECIHTSEISQDELQGDMQQSQHCESITERLVHNVPEMEDLLGTGKK